MPLVRNRGYDYNPTHMHRELIRTWTATVLLLVFVTQCAIAGIDNKATQYVGGTWTDIKEGTEGKLDTTDLKMAKFVKGKKLKPIEIPYDTVSSLEYGQKAGRRVGATIGWGVTTLGIAALPLLLSKKRKHYFTIGYEDATGAKQGVVMQLGKDITRQTLMIFETRSGKQVEYESDEAKKHVGN